MCFYIGIEDLAANALIELLKTKDGNLNQYSVTYAELEKYGTEVVHFLNKKGETAVLVLSRANTNRMFRKYSDFFEEKETEVGLAIALRKGKTVPELITRFRTYLALDVMMAFMNKETVKVLTGNNV